MLSLNVIKSLQLQRAGNQQCSKHIVQKAQILLRSWSYKMVMWSRKWHIKKK